MKKYQVLPVILMIIAEIFNIVAATPTIARSVTNVNDIALLAFEIETTVKIEITHTNRGCQKV